MLSADTNKPSSGGVYTCQTCSALFTCLDYYQKHRRQHAETEGVKLLTCAHCTYFSDNAFHYNWHIMSHASSPPHRCDVCAPADNSMSTVSGNDVTPGGSSTAKQMNNLSANVGDANNIHHQTILTATASGHGSSSNGLNGANDLHLTERISDPIISSDGKRRSIATETNDDLIHLSQIFSSSPSSPSSNTASKTLGSRQDSSTNNQDDDDEETEEEDEEDDEETENDETDVEMNYESNVNHCDNGAMLQTPLINNSLENQQQQQQQQFYYEMNDEDEEDDEEEDDEDEDDEDADNQEVPQQQQQPYQEYNGVVDIGDELGGVGASNEVEYHEDGADQDDGAPDAQKVNNCDTTQQQQPSITAQPSTDVYDFNSDEDLEQNGSQFKLPSSKSSGTGAVPSSSQAHHHQPQITNIQFLNAPAAASGQQANLQSLPHQSPQGTANQPPFLQMNPNAFLFPAGPTTAGAGTFGNVNHHHPHHHQTNHVNPHQQGAAAAIFNPNAFTTAANAPIQLLSIQPFPHQNNAGNATAAFLQAAAAAAQTNGASNAASAPGSLNLVPVATPAAPSHPSPNDASGGNQTGVANSNPSKLVYAKKTPKRMSVASSTATTQSSTQSVSTAASITAPGNTNGTLIQPQDYVPIKGKGKGNRKPRITLVSVINGITVGADGIRRKFQCSLCGNGKSFKTKSHLQRHMLTHTGEKPYQCHFSECGAKFNQSSSLRNHIIAIHTKKFPHTCMECGKGFLMPAVLQKHLTSTGHQSPINVSTPTGNSQSTGNSSTKSSNSEDSSNSIIASGTKQQQPTLTETESMSTLLQYSNNETDDQDSSVTVENSTHQNNNGNGMEEFPEMYIKEEPDDENNDDEDENDDEDDNENETTTTATTSNSVPTGTRMASFGHQQQQQVTTTMMTSTPVSSSGSSFPGSSSQPNLFFILANSNR